MISRAFMSMVNASPALRRALWRTWYGLLARRFRRDDWTFMNYGFADDEAPALDPEDEPNRHAIQLYRHVLSSLEVAGKDVLEVGSGRGGGVSYMARYLAPRSVVGLDFARENVAFSRVRHPQPNASFEVGDAEAMPFRDARFDIVVNVESSHCYGSMPDFLAEVVRVLRPGGAFAWADMRPASDMAELDDLFAASGLRIVADQDITENVLQALNLDEEAKRAAIAAHIPRFLQPSFRDFSGVRDSRVYTALATGQARYRCVPLVK